MSKYKKIAGYVALFVAGAIISTGIYYSTNIRGIKNKDKLENTNKESIQLDENISDLEKEMNKFE